MAIFRTPEGSCQVRCISKLTNRKVWPSKKVIKPSRRAYALAKASVWGYYGLLPERVGGLVFMLHCAARGVVVMRFAAYLAAVTYAP